MLLTPIARLPTSTPPIRAPAISSAALQLRQLDALARAVRWQRQQRRLREELGQRIIRGGGVNEEAASTVAAQYGVTPEHTAAPKSKRVVLQGIGPPCHIPVHTVYAIPLLAVRVRVRDVLRAAVLRAARAGAVNAAGAAGARERGERGEVREGELWEVGEGGC